jgi:hypothetical protein
MVGASKYHGIMSLGIDLQRGLQPDLRTGPHGAVSPAVTGPLVWQRTDTVGTELVVAAGGDSRSAEGTAVVGGPLAYTARFHADLDAGSGVRALHVTTSGDGWTRSLRLSRDAGGDWTCGTEETGDLHRSLARGGHAAPPLPGIDDPARLRSAAVVRLDYSPIFVTWALRRLGLASGDGPVTVPEIRVLTPSLLVVPTLSTYQLISAHRLRIGGREPAALYHLDQHGVVTYRPGRLRLAR